MDNAYTKPTDFTGNKRKRSCTKERTADEVKALMVQLAEQDGTTVAQHFSTQHGVFSTASPFLPEVLPGFDIVKFRPQDIMHMEACGIALRELSDVIHHFVKVLKLFDIPQLNGQLAR